MDRPSTVLLFSTLLTVAVGTSCRTSRPDASPMMRAAAPDIRLTAGELRLRVRAKAGLWAGIIETAADRAIVESASPDLRYAATRWKAQSIPVLAGALFDADPLVAILDGWGYVVQMASYFETGAGASSPAPLPTVAATTCQRIVDDIKQSFQRAATPEALLEAEGFVARWATRHPLDSLTARPSLVEAVAQLAGTSSLGALASVGAIEETAADISSRLDLYSSLLPRQVRWQAELLLADGAPAAALASAGAIPLAITSMPIDVSAERQALLAAIHAEHALAQVWIRDERTAITAALAAEREAILHAITVEREATLAALQSEREQAFVELEAMRAATFRDLDGVVKSSVLDMRRHLIDHFFLRAAQLLGGLLVLGLLGFVVARRVGRQRA